MSTDKKVDFSGVSASVDTTAQKVDQVAHRQQAVAFRVKVYLPQQQTQGIETAVHIPHDKVAAAEAWKQTIDLFNRTLRSDAVEAATPKG